LSNRKLGPCGRNCAVARRGGPCDCIRAGTQNNRQRRKCRHRIQSKPGQPLVNAVFACHFSLVRHYNQIVQFSSPSAQPAPRAVRYQRNHSERSDGAELEIVCGPFAGSASVCSTKCLFKTRRFVTFPEAPYQRLVSIGQPVASLTTRKVVESWRQLREVRNVSQSRYRSFLPDLNRNLRSRPAFSLSILNSLRSNLELRAGGVYFVFESGEVRQNGTAERILRSPLRARARPRHLCPLLCPLWGSIGIIQYRMLWWLIAQKGPNRKGLVHIKRYREIPSNH